MKNPWPFLLALALIFYANGAAFIESFVNYPSWRLIGANEFLRYHHFIGPRVIALLVAPALLATVFTFIMLRHRPATIPLWSVWTAIGLQVVVWVSTAALQIPIQREFAATGFSESHLVTLMTTNFWLRRIPLGLTAALFLWMTHRVISTAQRSGSSPTRR